MLNQNPLVRYLWLNPTVSRWVFLCIKKAKQTERTDLCWILTCELCCGDSGSWYILMDLNFRLLPQNSSSRHCWSLHFLFHMLHKCLDSLFQISLSKSVVPHCCSFGLWEVQIPSFFFPKSFLCFYIPQVNISGRQTDSLGPPWSVLDSLSSITSFFNSLSFLLLILSLPLEKWGKKVPLLLLISLLLSTNNSCPRS